MHCSELERYLEACLDGQLGDSRRQSLQDHLRLCRGCATRVEELKRFEADLQRRLRAMQHEVSLWQPLGLEVVEGGHARPEPPVALVPRGDDVPVETPGDGLLPARIGRGHRLRSAAPARPVEPKPRRRLQNLVGVAILAAAAGALADLALSGVGWFAGDRRSVIYRAYLEGSAELQLETGEPARLSAWFADQLGEPVNLPTLPDDFTLIGGAADATGLAEDAALALYSTADGPALLVIESSLDRPLAASAAEPELAVEDGLSRLDWRNGPHVYSLVSALPPDELAAVAAD